MSLFRDLEKRIDAQLKKLFTSENAAAQGKELIEIQRLILDEIEDHAQMLPRARRRFPYNDLIVRIAAAEPDRRSAIAVVFVEGNALQTEIEQPPSKRGDRNSRRTCESRRSAGRAAGRNCDEGLSHHLQHQGSAPSRKLEIETTGAADRPAWSSRAPVIRDQQDAHPSRPSGGSAG